MAIDIGAAFGGLSDLLEMLLRFFVWVVGEIAAAVAYLFGGREAGRRARERARGMTFALLVLLILGATATAWLMSAETRRVHAAQDLVVRQCETVAADRDQKGRPIDPPQKRLVDDPWGKPITIVVERGLVHDTVRVSSAGPDGVEGTNDDISETQRVLIGKEAVGEEVGDRLKGFVADQIDRFRDEQEVRPEEE